MVRVILQAMRWRSRLIDRVAWRWVAPLEDRAAFQVAVDEACGCDLLQKVRAFETPLAWYWLSHHLPTAVVGLALLLVCAIFLLSSLFVHFTVAILAAGAWAVILLALAFMAVARFYEWRERCDYPHSVIIHHLRSILEESYRWCERMDERDQRLHRWIESDLASLARFVQRSAPWGQQKAKYQAGALWRLRGRIDELGGDNPARFTAAVARLLRRFACD